MLLRVDIKVFGDHYLHSILSTFFADVQLIKHC